MNKRFVKKLRFAILHGKHIIGYTNKFDNGYALALINMGTDLKFYDYDVQAYLILSGNGEWIYQ